MVEACVLVSRERHGSVDGPKHLLLPPRLDPLRQGCARRSGVPIRDRFGPRLRATAEALQCSLINRPRVHSPLRPRPGGRCPLPRTRVPRRRMARTAVRSSSRCRPPVSPKLHLRPAPPRAASRHLRHRSGILEGGPPDIVPAWSRRSRRWAVPARCLSPSTRARPEPSSRRASRTMREMPL
jgi:hypothetical protein